MFTYKYTKSLSYREFAAVYKDRLCPLCADNIGSDSVFFAHKRHNDPNRCARLEELTPFLKGVKKALVDGMSPEEIRRMPKEEFMNVDPWEYEEFEGWYLCDFLPSCFLENSKRLRSILTHIYMHICLGIPALDDENEHDVGPSCLMDVEGEGGVEGGETGLDVEVDMGGGGEDHHHDPWESYVPAPPSMFDKEEEVNDGGLLYEDASISVLAASTFIWSLAKTAGWRRDDIDELLKFMHHVLLPAGNCMPSTMYKLQRVIGEPHLGDCTFRMCPRGCVLWHPRDEVRLGIKKHKDTKCPKCPTSLFTESRGALVPTQTCIYFGIASMVK